jgi:hypothetical protein
MSPKIHRRVYALSALALSHFMPELAQQKLAFSCASVRESFYSFFGDYRQW